MLPVSAHCKHDALKALLDGFENRRKSRGVRRKMQVPGSNTELHTAVSAKGALIKTNVLEFGRCHRSSSL